jgi:hypothetical protein
LKARYPIVYLFVMMLASLVQANEFPAECPSKATYEIVDDPGAWADQCFRAMNGRLPSPYNVGESQTTARDLNSDGKLEHLEVRGTGNKLKQIYVFDETPDGYIYAGLLTASIDFEVVDEGQGLVVLTNLYRVGDSDVRLQRIEYHDGEFVVVAESKSQ